MSGEEKILSLLTALVKDVTELKKDIVELKNDVADLKYDVAELKAAQQRTSESVVKIENDQGKRLDALIDGYSLMYDVTKGIRMDIASIKTDLEKQDMLLKYYTAERHIDPENNFLFKKFGRPVVNG